MRNWATCKKSLQVAGALGDERQVMSGGLRNYPESPGSCGRVQNGTTVLDLARAPRIEEVGRERSLAAGT